jgi:mRNA interferase MazF
MKHGEVRRHKFINPVKKRSVRILTRDSVLEYLGEITIAPITTTVRNIPSEVFLTKTDGMPRNCAVNCDHLQPVSKGKIGSLITSMSAFKMVAVGEAIRFAVDI